MLGKAHKPSNLTKRWLWAFCLWGVGAACVFFLCEVAADPQPAARVSITIKARGTRQPIADALITVSCADDVIEALTDPQGVAELAILSSASCVYIIDAPGYITPQAAPLGAGEALDIYLDPDPDNPADQSFYTYAAASAQSAGSRQIEDVGVLAGVRNDPIQGLQALPGLSRTGLGAGLLLVRGTMPQDTRVWLDDVPLPVAVHLGGARTIVAAESLEAVELFASNYPIRFGGALGGIVELRQKPIASQLHHGAVGVDFVEASLSAQGPITDSIQYAVAGRRSYLEVLSPLLASAASLESYTIPSYWDSQLRLHWQLSKHHELRLMGLAAGDEMALVSGANSDAALRMQSTIHRVALSHHYQKPHLKQRMTWSLGTDFQDVVDTYHHYARDGWRLNGREVFKWSPLDWLTLEAGGDLQVTDQPLTIGPGMESERWLDLTKTVDQGLVWESGAYFSWTLSKEDWLAVAVGWRVSDSSFLNEVAHDQKLWVQVQPWDLLQLSLSGGSVSQPPSPLEVYLLDERLEYDGLGVYHRWQRGLHLSASATVKSSAYWPLSLSLVVYSHALNPIVTDDYPISFSDFELDQFGYQGAWRTRGAELVLKHARHHQFEGWIAYSLMQVEGKDEPSSSWRKGRHEQPQSLTVVGVVHLPAHWRVSARFGFSTGVPFSPSSTSLFETEMTHRFRATPGVEPFHRLDLRADKTWLFDLWQLSLYLDVQGAYFHSNIELVADGEEGFVTTRGLPILPSLGLKGQY